VLDQRIEAPNQGARADCAGPPPKPPWAGPAARAGCKRQCR